jgi:hypothetical protein
MSQNWPIRKAASEAISRRFDRRVGVHRDRARQPHDAGGEQAHAGRQPSHAAGLLGAVVFIHQIGE